MIATHGRIVLASVAGTVGLAAFALAAVLFPDTLAVPYAAVATALFVAGCASFLGSYVIAAGRSRTEVLSVAGIYLLSGSAPAPTRRWLLGPLAAQVVIVIAAASARPFTALAFGVLAPLFGLGLVGLWGARNGTFPEREDLRGRRTRP